MPAADQVHPWDSLVGSDTRVKLDHGTIIARVNPRAPLKVRSPTLLTALAPPAVNSWMGLNSVCTLVARGVCCSPIMSCVAPMSKITECPSVCVPPTCATPVFVVSKVVGLLGCGGPKCPLLWACSFLLACSAAALVVADAVWHGRLLLVRPPVGIRLGSGATLANTACTGG